MKIISQETSKAHLSSDEAAMQRPLYGNRFSRGQLDGEKGHKGQRGWQRVADRNVRFFPSTPASHLFNQIIRPKNKNWFRCCCCCCFYFYCIWDNDDETEDFLFVCLEMHGLLNKLEQVELKKQKKRILVFKKEVFSQIQEKFIVSNFSK